jgi:hypothetical protein
MANQEHLDILKQGVVAWNRWRKEHSDIQPDLKGADLRDVEFGYTQLRQADLSQADLGPIKLSGRRALFDVLL